MCSRNPSKRPRRAAIGLVALAVALAAAGCGRSGAPSAASGGGRLQVVANSHRWSFPADVRAVIERIVADYQRLDPRDAGYFAQQQRRFETVGLARYDELRSEIRSRYAGVPVGYSESIFQGLGGDL